VIAGLRRALVTLRGEGPAAPVVLKACNEEYFGELPVMRTATSE
jgi:hypothetical protein